MCVYCVCALRGVNCCMQSAHLDITKILCVEVTRDFHAETICQIISTFPLVDLDFGLHRS